MRAQPRWARCVPRDRLTRIRSHAHLANGTRGWRAGQLVSFVLASNAIGLPLIDAVAKDCERMKALADARTARQAEIRTLYEEWEAKSAQLE